MGCCSASNKGGGDKPPGLKPTVRRPLARSEAQRASDFLTIEREDVDPAPVADRITSFGEFVPTMRDAHAAQQAARCIDCGTPYCHTGCPVNNEIPDWNEMVVRGQWKAASHNLHLTNNFPEITGRICPAPCEEACTLYLHDAPVTIKSIERAIADRAICEGWMVPEPAAIQSNSVVAIVGSGPAGLAAAQQLVRRGHRVRVYERDRRPGGLLRYGIPDFKLAKVHVDRRISQLKAEGVRFSCSTTIGRDVSAQNLVSRNDAVIMACGAGLPRDLTVPGVHLSGVCYAMAYLRQQNMRIGGERIHGEWIDAHGKNVVVIGSGDTACDCIGTAFRQGARTVTQIDIHPRPPLVEDKLMSWPFRPVKFRVSSSQAEGAARTFQTGTLRLVGRQGRVRAVRCAKVDNARGPIPDTGFDLPADLVLIAIGFSGPDIGQIDSELDLERTRHGMLATSGSDYATNRAGVFAAGDIRRGPSLVVWAIREGRKAAASVDAFLKRSASIRHHSDREHRRYFAARANSNNVEPGKWRYAMKVKEVMHRGVAWVGPETPVAEIARLMRDHDVGAIPIGEDDRLIGMVTDRDIVCKGIAGNGWFDAGKATALDVMTEGIHCCREDEDLDKAIRHMEALQVRRLPVISKSKRMVGILSLGDISELASKDVLAACVKSVSSHHH